MRGESDAPPGYVVLESSRGQAVAKAAHSDAIRSALAAGTLYDWAAMQPGRREYRGRAAAYGVALSDGARVVVRHSWHGGTLAPVTRDLFLPPTRAPRELDTALRLRAAGVPTPDVIAYAVYPAGPVFLRADVATAEVPDARDLGDLLASTEPGDPERAEALPLVGELLIFLERAGARHPDLNVKNILIGRDDEARRALVIDVDRVVFDRPLSPSVTAANQARLLRSIRRGVERRGVRMRDDDYRLLFARARTSGVVA